MSASRPTVEDRAKAFVAELAAGEWAHPKTAFDGAMASAAPAATLAEIWKSLEAKSGAFRSVEGTTVREEQGHQVVLTACKFERGAQTLRLVFDRDDKLAGFFIQPAAATSWTAPPYADASKFEERDVQVGTTPALPGTLTLPKGKGPHPAIVLVHGSGPNDRDESVGGVKPFKDLAWGFASRGIAVLRYEKRSRVSPSVVVTHRDEVDVAALDAIRLLLGTPEIDPKSVYLLGHSQGGYLAPRIASASPKLAGVIILAGSTRPVQDSIVDQIGYFTTLSPDNADLRAKLDVARAFKQRVDSPALRPDEEVALPFGGTAKGAYFLDVRGYEPPAVAKGLHCRVFILQGDRDYQVTKKDFDGWKTTLASRPNVTMKRYASLNHLFVSGTGTPGPAEYEQPGHIAEDVLTDIAVWIAASKRP